MSPWVAIRTCLTRKYATFSGRASRSEYWWFFAFYFGVGLVIGFLGKWPQLLYVGAMICPLVAAGARRLQDTGRPGGYIFVPLAAMILFALLAPAAPIETGTPGAQVVSTGSVLVAGVLLVVQLAIALTLLHWLTRPSQLDVNAYGPPPTAAEKVTA